MAPMIVETTATRIQLSVPPVTMPVISGVTTDSAFHEFFNGEFFFSLSLRGDGGEICSVREGSMVADATNRAHSQRLLSFSNHRPDCRDGSDENSTTCGMRLNVCVSFHERYLSLSRY